MMASPVGLASHHSRADRVLDHVWIETVEDSPAHLELDRLDDLAVVGPVVRVERPARHDPEPLGVSMGIPQTYRRIMASSSQSIPAALPRS
jgi:hypothetical protein